MTPGSEVTQQRTARGRKERHQAIGGLIDGSTERSFCFLVCTHMYILWGVYACMWGDETWMSHRLCLVWARTESTRSPFWVRHPAPCPSGRSPLSNPPEHVLGSSAVSRVGGAVHSAPRQVAPVDRDTLLQACCRHLQSPRAACPLHNVGLRGTGKSCSDSSFFPSGTLPDWSARVSSGALHTCLMGLLDSSLTRVLRSTAQASTQPCPVRSLPSRKPSPGPSPLG